MSRVELDGQEVSFDCPGCGFNHGLRVEGSDGGGPKWGFNGDTEHPTITPSILARWGQKEVIDPSEPIVWEDVPGFPGARRDARPHREVEHVCHSFVTGGRIQFLDDCTHKLAGQTVDLPEIEP